MTPDAIPFLSCRGGAPVEVEPCPARRAPSPSAISSAARVEGSACIYGARPRPRHTLTLRVIPNGAGQLFLPASLLRSTCPDLVGKIPIRSESGRPADVRNLSYGLSGDFPAAAVDLARGFSAGGATGFCAGGDCSAGFAAAGFPTVKYLRIFSRRLGPSPRIARRSSTDLNGP